MKKKIRFFAVSLNNLVTLYVLSSPVMAQTSTPSSQATGSSSTLPDAGNSFTSLLLIIFGTILLVLGSSLLVKQARQDS